MELEPPDAGAVLEATRQLAADPTPEFAEVLEILRALIPCESASFNDVVLAHEEARHVLVPEAENERLMPLKPAFDRHIHEHPLINDFAGRPLLGGVRFADLDDEHRILDTDLYRHFYEPLGIRFQMVIQLPSPGDVVVGYALNRSAELGEFTDRDVDVLNALEPHLVLHHRLTLDRAQARIMADEAGRDRWEVVTVRSDGVVESASAMEPTPPLRSGDRVPEQVRALMPAWGSTEPQRGLLDVDGVIWECVVSPTAAGPAVLAVRRPEIGSSADLERLRTAGLTERQAEVACALADTGGTNSQLASILGISEGTVKKHLEVVFAAVGAESRAAAAVAVRALLD